MTCVSSYIGIAYGETLRMSGSEVVDTQQKKGKAKSQEVEELKVKLEKQIAVTIWIQTIGVLMEAVLLQRLNALSQENIEGETEALAGSWIQLIGLVAEAVGVTQQAFEPSLPITFEGQRVAIAGNWLQSIGAALEAIGGEKILLGELLTQVPDFVE